MNRSIIRRLPIIGVALVAAGLLYRCLSLTTIGERSERRGPMVQESKSDNQLHQLSSMILDFRRKQGRYPTKWSELLNEQIDAAQIWMFYSTSDIARERRPKNWDTDSSLIDRYSDYRIAPSDLPDGVIASERPGLWSDRTMAICFAPRGQQNSNDNGAVSNLQVKRMLEVQ